MKEKNRKESNFIGGSLDSGKVHIIKIKTSVIGTIRWIKYNRPKYPIVAPYSARTKQ